METICPTLKSKEITQIQIQGVHRYSICMVLLANPLELSFKDLLMKETVRLRLTYYSDVIWYICYI